MVTKYNIELAVSSNIDNAPSKLYDLSCKQFEDARLIGKKHVNHFGRMYEEYDVSCHEFVEGRFDIFYRGDETRSMREILEEERIKATGFDEVKQDMLDIGETAVDILEKYSALATLPFNIYTSLPFTNSMELNTPCGIQSTHVHTEEKKIIQFWKPEKDQHWYDFDTFKDYIRDLILKTPLPPENQSYLNRILNFFPSKIFNSRKKLGIEAMENPDSIDRVLWLAWF